MTKIDMKAVVIGECVYLILVFCVNDKLIVFFFNSADMEKEDHIAKIDIDMKRMILIMKKMILAMNVDTKGDLMIEYGMLMVDMVMIDTVVTEKMIVKVEMNGVNCLIIFEKI